VNFKHVDEEIDFDAPIDDEEKPTTEVKLVREQSQTELDFDQKSIYVKNVDLYATPQDLEEHFKTCGPIDRITILCDKYTGVSKGYAFIEFSTLDAKERSKDLNNSLLKGQLIKVDDKRKNIPMYFERKVHNVKKVPFQSLRNRITKRNFEPY